LLEALDWKTIPHCQKLIDRYLKDPEINVSVWRYLAQQYPTQLEKLLQEALEKPEFSLQTDLYPLLSSFSKRLSPELPEIASVPLHLHNLFQDAVLEVHRSKPKSKSKERTKAGFQLRS
jgi:hypothetical protein